MPARLAGQVFELALRGMFQQPDAACLTHNVVVLEDEPMRNHVGEAAMEHLLD